MSEQDTISNPPSECTEISEEDASMKSVKSRTTRSSRQTPGISEGEQRRHSTRSVKRRKFDDELVESSLKHSKQEKARTSVGSTTSKLAADSSPTPSAGEVVVKVEPTEPVVTPEPPTPIISRATRSAASTSSQPVTAAAPPPDEKPPVFTSVPSQSKPTPTPAAEKRKATTKSTARSKSRKSKKVAQPAQANATKTLGKWKPQDDLLLTEAVLQTSDLKSVHVGVKFSCNFTLQDIEDRWYTLLYNEKISKVAMTAVQQLPYDEVLRVQSKALFSKQEEELLGTVTVASQPTQATFSELLKSYIGKFHRARTSKSLQEHWTLMKHYHLLPDQSVQPLPRNDHILNFSDAEEMLDDRQLSEPANVLSQKEMALNDRKQKKEIRQLEQELSKWQVLVESISGTSQPEFDNQTLAILRGRLVRYLMRSKEISIGRSAKDNQVDVDLALEGPASKISRRQGTIKLRNNGEFILTNVGKRPMYVDSKSVQPNGKLKLHNNSVIEITCLKFIFLINQDLIRGMKPDNHKSNSNAPS